MCHIKKNQVPWTKTFGVFPRELVWTEENDYRDVSCFN